MNTHKIIRQEYIMTGIILLINSYKYNLSLEEGDNSVSKAGKEAFIWYI